MPTIKGWIEECENNHSCSPTSDSKLPKRVLDVERLKEEDKTVLLETSDQKGKYIALSHCWGKKDFIQTSDENIDQHKGGIAFSELPRTFQDVVQITRSLGIRYIWIDSLCIIQDNKEDWANESSKMANIYENCYLNISATGSSDSSGGCFGDRWLTNRARVYPQKFEFDPWIWTITNLPLSIRINSQPIHLFIRPSLGEAHRNFLDLYPEGDSVITAPLLHRGWDFQERVLSPRTIHFHSAELIWEFRAGDHCECGGITSDLSDLRCWQSFLKKIV